MNHKTRLGPIAIFLTIVTMVITTLAILTTATSHADLAMAERFAEVTRTRYELSAEAESFLADAAGAHAAGTDMRTIDVAGGTDDTYIYENEKNGYRIYAEFTIPDENGNFEIVKWKLNKVWAADDPMQGIWKGF